jgi:ring-1,2-phenylacetyl-CoA epoxidase subunit PaaE
MNNYSLTIVDIKKETAEACTICFKQPGLRKIKYKAGQYISLIFRINGRKFARAYSFSSSPSNSSLIEITVKRVSGGVVSNYINDKLKIGDIVETSSPMGNFTFENQNNHGTVYFWGVGSGITPLFSIINELLLTNTSRCIHLIYGNKNKESIIFHEKLEDLKKKHPLTFKMTNFFSKIENVVENDLVKKGRIDSTFIESLITQDKKQKESIHYICGPSQLKNVVKKVLNNYDIPATSIFSEEFELNIDPDEFELVENSNVRVLFHGKDFEIHVPKGKSILEVALDNNIEIPYSCQTGDCNTCKAMLVEGNIKMLGLKNKRVDLANNEFLLCCSYPLTNRIYLKVE